MASSEETDRGIASTLLTSREDAEQAAATWVARRATPEWTTADAAAFEAWLGESVSHRAAYYRLNAAWEEAGRLGVLTRGAQPSTQLAQIGTTVRIRRRRWPLALAASVILTLAAGTLWLYRDELLQANRYTTVVGGLEAVPLPDGSHVTLNTDSQLRVELTPQERDVVLDRGEAFFEVAKDPRRPFVVNAGRKRVVAVGTEFSVFREGDDVRVTVAEGTVRLEDPMAQPMLLSAGSVARTREDVVLVQKQGSAEIQQHLSWRSGLITFRDTPLAEAVAEFNRYNERKVVIEDPAIASLQLGGVFRSTNIDSFIALLEQGFPVRAREEGNAIVLSHN